MRRLVRVEITALLGRFSPTIDIPSDWEFVILHGPNGVGKTRMLEIISAALQLRVRSLEGLPFRAATFRFDDGTELAVSKEKRSNDALLDEEDSIRFSVSGIEGRDIQWSYKPGRVHLPAAMLREIDHYAPIDQVGPALWLDRTGEELTLEDVIERYGHQLPFPTDAQGDPPPGLTEFTGQVDVHLIETQRLLRYERTTRVRGRLQRRATVQEFATNLVQRIADALAHNSRISQQLDRSFPRRLLSSSPRSDIGDDEIRRRYQEQLGFRTSLSDIAVLDPSDDLPLPDRVLEPWERAVLWTYLDDSDRKLDTFRDLLDRVTLLREVINSRFLFKAFRIDAEKGFLFTTEEGLDVPPEQLSSGEQHELVLLYDLLFNVRPGSVVLIDEPEISLHVSWQQQFLNDIRRIATLSDLQFIIATHSPQVIHTWSERAIPLVPSELMNRAGL